MSLDRNLALALGISVDVERKSKELAELSEQYEQLKNVSALLRSQGKSIDENNRQELMKQLNQVQDRITHLTTEIINAQAAAALSIQNVNGMQPAQLANLAGIPLEGLREDDEGDLQALRQLLRENVVLMSEAFHAVSKKATEVASSITQSIRDVKTDPTNSNQVSSESLFTKAIDFLKNTAQHAAVPFALAQHADRQAYELRRLTPEANFTGDEITKLAGTVIPAVTTALGGRVDDSAIRQMALTAGTRGFAMEEMEKVLKIGGVMKEALGVQAPQAIETLVGIEKNLLLSINKTPELITQAQALADKSTQSSEAIMKNMMDAASFVARMASGDKGTAAAQYGALATAFQDTGPWGEAASRSIGDFLFTLQKGNATVQGANLAQMVESMSGENGLMEKAAGGDVLSAMKAIDAVAQRVLEESKQYSEKNGGGAAAERTYIETVIAHQLEPMGINRSLLETAILANQQGGYGRVDPELGRRRTLDEWAALTQVPEGAQPKMEDDSTGTRSLLRMKELSEVALEGVGYTLRNELVKPLEKAAGYAADIANKWQEASKIQLAIPGADAMRRVPGVGGLIEDGQVSVGTLGNLLMGGALAAGGAKLLSKVPGISSLLGGMFGPKALGAGAGAASRGAAGAAARAAATRATASATAATGILSSLGTSIATFGSTLAAAPVTASIGTISLALGTLAASYAATRGVVGLLKKVGVDLEELVYKVNPLARMVKEGLINWMVGDPAKTNVPTSVTSSERFDPNKVSTTDEVKGFFEVPTPPTAPSPTITKIPYREEIVEAAAERNLDPALLAALISQESSFNPNAVSKAGAMGLAQVMPKTGPELGLHTTADFMDPEKSINAGAEYLSRMLKMFDGDVRSALTAYNWGPGNMQAYQAGTKTEVPQEAQEYADRVLGRYGRFAELTSEAPIMPRELMAQTPRRDPEELMRDPIGPQITVDQDKVVSALKQLGDRLETILGQSVDTRATLRGPSSVSPDVGDIGDFAT